MSYPLIAVVWNDAHGAGAVTEDPTSIPHHPWKMTTYGAAIKVDEVGITIAGEVSEDGQIRNRTFIPREMIVSVDRLRAVKPKKKKAPEPLPEEKPTEPSV